MRDLLDLLKENKVLLSDGAWGTMLFEKGLQAGDCPEFECSLPEFPADCGCKTGKITLYEKLEHEVEEANA